MTKDLIIDSIEKAISRIAPYWTLENSVAVNPYLGFSETKFADAAKILKNRGGINIYMPIAYYLNKIRENQIAYTDLEKALQKHNLELSVSELITKGNQVNDGKDFSEYPKSLLNISVSGSEKIYDNELLNDLCEWFGENMITPSKTGKLKGELYLKWREQALLNPLPEISGLKDWRKLISELPVNADIAIYRGMEEIPIPVEMIETYLHTLLLKRVGWSSYYAGIDFQNKVYGKPSDHMKSILAILIGIETTYLKVLKKQYGNKELSKIVSQNLDKLDTNQLDEVLKLQAIFQDALDFVAERELVEKFRQTPTAIAKAEDIKAQMAFCIDVRSEVYRRNLEQVDNRIETIGFAGFFGMSVKYEPITNGANKNQCPVLIPSSIAVKESGGSPTAENKEKEKILSKGILNKAWDSFKSGPASSFSFVSPLGIFTLPKLIGNALGITRPVQEPKKAEFGRVLDGVTKLDLSRITLKEKTTIAQNALTGMGLTSNFAPFILIAGHGASTTNNPHATGLECGACGGNSGEINALTAAQIFNDQAVRDRLKASGIIIPEATKFVACLHNTTTDEIEILSEEIKNLSQFKSIELSLKKASKKTREERSNRFAFNKEDVHKSIVKRTNDWSQVRPEWGLAGCNAFVIAPRTRTTGVNLNGRAFLHSYKWETDNNFNLLESIMTAPMIVTSWINLQYYASTVDNEKMGAGNKTLHNVVDGKGVLEGATGDLKLGLPFQSIHDGKDFQHLPNRLNVIIEAPTWAIDEILRKHENLKNLVENEWIKLFVMDEFGKVVLRYTESSKWETTEKRTTKTNLKVENLN